MCERCCEIDIRMERYLALASSLVDKEALEAIGRLIAALKAIRASLHPN